MGEARPCSLRPIRLGRASSSSVPPHAPRRAHSRGTASLRRIVQPTCLPDEGRHHSESQPTLTARPLSHLGVVLRVAAPILSLHLSRHPHTEVLVHESVVGPQSLEPVAQLLYTRLYYPHRKLRKLCCHRVRPRVVPRVVDDVQSQTLQQPHRLREVLLRLEGESDDDVRGECNAGHGIAERVADGDEVTDAVLAVHATQHGVGTRLERKDAGTVTCTGMWR